MFALLLFSALPPTAEIRQMPGVVEVQIRAAEKPTHRVVHLLNWHFVTREDFALLDDVAKYETFLEGVEAVQREQVVFLRKLGARKIHCEGLTDKNRAAFVERVATLKALKPPKGDSPVELLLIKFIREDSLQLGAPGRLLMSGDIDEVLPAEDAKAFDGANPVKGGKVSFDASAVKRREDAIAKRLLSAKESVIVLGGDHDLSDNLPDGVEYLRVTLKKFRELSE